MNGSFILVLIFIDIYSFNNIFIYMHSFTKRHKGEIIHTRKCNCVQKMSWNIRTEVLQASFIEHVLKTLHYSKILKNIIDSDTCVHIYKKM